MSAHNVSAPNTYLMNYYVAVSDWDTVCDILQEQARNKESI